MVPVSHSRCQLCVRRVESNDHQRVIGNQRYRRLLCLYIRLNGDQISETGKICDRCHTSLSKSRRNWTPSYYMQLVRQNNNNERLSLDVASSPQVMVSKDHQVPDIEMINIDDANQD